VILAFVLAIILAIVLAAAIGRLSITKGQYSTASSCSPINHTATAWAILEGEDVEMGEDPWLIRMTRVASAPQGPGYPSRTIERSNYRTS
jgi:hypothetical protein